MKSIREFIHNLYKRYWRNMLVFKFEKDKTVDKTSISKRLKISGNKFYHGILYSNLQCPGLIGLDMHIYFRARYSMLLREWETLETLMSKSSSVRRFVDHKGRKKDTEKDFQLYTIDMDVLLENGMDYIFQEYIKKNNRVDDFSRICHLVHQDSTGIEYEVYLVFREAAVKKSYLHYLELLCRQH